MGIEENPEEHLYDMGMNIAKSRIEKSDFFICLLIKGIEKNQSLLDQIDYARKLRKAFYIIAEEGAREPANLDGADIRGRFYYANRTQKEVERASKSMFEQVMRDFPDTREITTQKGPNMSHIKWPPKEADGPTRS